MPYCMYRKALYIHWPMLPLVHKVLYNTVKICDGKKYLQTQHTVKNCGPKHTMHLDCKQVLLLKVSGCLPIHINELKRSS